VEVVGGFGGGSGRGGGEGGGGGGGGGGSGGGDGGGGGIGSDGGGSSGSIRFLVSYNNSFMGPLWPITVPEICGVTQSEPAKRRGSLQQSDEPMSATLARSLKFNGPPSKLCVELWHPAFGFQLNLLCFHIGSDR
ncbi:unnamed protein product, partial [Prunus brigantina]